MMNTRALLLSGLIAGVLMALFSELPYLSIANCCLCLWVWAGGIFAVYLYRRFDQTVGPTTLNQGLLVGLVAGLVSVIVGTILAAIIGQNSWEGIFQFLSAAQGSQVDLGPFREILESPVFFFFFELLTNLVFYSLFGLIGGILGTLIFKGKPGASTTVV